RLSSAYGHYKNVGLASGLTGAQAARTILDQAGLQNVAVEATPGTLSHHYDPTSHTLRLSQDNFYGRSVAAVGVAAHEAGHALQHQAAYGPLQLRMALVPVTKFASFAWMGILGVGFIVPTLFHSMIWLAVALFSVLTFFQLVTLPVEYDASRRAKEQLL